MSPPRGRFDGRVDLLQLAASLSIHDALGWLE